MLNNLLSNYLFDTLEPIAKWISVGVIGTMLISLLVIFFGKKESGGGSNVAALHRSSFGDFSSHGEKKSYSPKYFCSMRVFSTRPIWVFIKGAE